MLNALYYYIGFLEYLQIFLVVVVVLNYYLCNQFTYTGCPVLGQDLNISCSTFGAFLSGRLQ